jgi:hypothetical protein
VALEAEKHERPGSSELSCIGDTKAQIFLSDKDTCGRVGYGNTGLFHLQTCVYLPTNNCHTLSRVNYDLNNNDNNTPSPRLYPSDMVGACDRSGVAIAIVKTLQDRVT